MRAKIGLLLPTTFSSKPASLEELQSFAEETELLGFDSLWTLDRVLHPDFVYDPLATIAMLASATKRIMFGTSILLTAFRNAVHLAKFLSTLDHLAGGRMILGVSLGGRPGEYEALGVSIKERVSRLNEGIKVMRMLWRGEPVTFQGKFYNLQAVTMKPRPYNGRIPVYLGGRADGVLKRVARIADGWIAGASATPQEVKSAVEKIRNFVEEVNRDESSIATVKLLYTWVSEDKGAARTMLKKWADAYYQTSYDVDKYCAFGPPGDCAELIDKFVEAGAQTIILGPPSTDISQVRRIADEVVPLLH